MLLASVCAGLHVVGTSVGDCVARRSESLSVEDRRHAELGRTSGEMDRGRGDFARPRGAAVGGMGVGDSRGAAGSAGDAGGVSNFCEAARTGDLAPSAGDRGGERDNWGDGVLESTDRSSVKSGNSKPGDGLCERTISKRPISIPKPTPTSQHRSWCCARHVERGGGGQERSDPQELRGRNVQKKPNRTFPAYSGPREITSRGAAITDSGGGGRIRAGLLTDSQKYMGRGPAERSSLARGPSSSTLGAAGGYLVKPKRTWALLHTHRDGRPGPNVATGCIE